MGSPTILDLLGDMQMKGMHLTVTLIRKYQGLRRSQNGKKEGEKAELKAEELQWKDGLIIQHIHRILTIGVGRMIGTLRKRVARLLMMGGQCVGGGPLVMGITMGHERDMDGMGIKMDTIKGRGVTMIKNQENQRLIFLVLMVEILMSGWTKPNTIFMCMRCLEMRV